MVVSIRDLIDMIMHGDLILLFTNFCKQLSFSGLRRVTILLLETNLHAYLLTMGIYKAI
jgi:hypothetical protein